MKIRTAILDDEPIALEILKDYVEKTTALELVAAQTDAFEILELVQNNKVDLVLLDIQMPELTGIQFMKIIGDKCAVILTTAYSEYALDGYEFNVIDYLLKPISYDRFVKAIDRINPVGRSQSVAGNNADFIFVKTGYITLKISTQDIVYIKAASDYIEYYLSDQKKILSLDNLKDVQGRLPENFHRIHKSYIINLKHIISIERHRITTKLTHLIPIGDSYKDGFFERIQS
ncbi:LytR/AlgR family response regulator transcription factor [Robertkochia solimangrovi]|uniref:LytR/AlgR family response regulator transcription factor n=1 Tax=Robertkochia solimangrovi TaxID=2213046 RepID=UPI001180E55F|nr:LytTR family DNA-binding domain-containing protein [Robertkochia solimangrovi]TRZ45282.1 DNA-binding response regulator [Robertkochia solimangrovi]